MKTKSTIFFILLGFLSSITLSVQAGSWGHSGVVGNILMLDGWDGIAIQFIDSASMEGGTTCSLPTAGYIKKGNPNFPYLFNLAVLSKTKNYSIRVTVTTECSAQNYPVLDGLELLQ